MRPQHRAVQRPPSGGHPHPWPAGGCARKKPGALCRGAGAAGAGRDPRAPPLPAGHCHRPVPKRDPPPPPIGKRTGPGWGQAPRCPRVPAAGIGLVLGSSAPPLAPAVSLCPAACWLCKSRGALAPLHPKAVPPPLPGWQHPQSLPPDPALPSASRNRAAPAGPAPRTSRTRRRTSGT